MELLHLSGVCEVGYSVCMLGYLWLVIAFCANGVANVLLKMAGENIVSNRPLVPQLLTNIPLIAGLALFALNVGFYFLALRVLPLSVAYPVMVGMTFLIVSSGAVLLFHETISLMQWIGFVCIMVGLVLATSH